MQLHTSPSVVFDALGRKPWYNVTPIGSFDGLISLFSWRVAQSLQTNASLTENDRASLTWVFGTQNRRLDAKFPGGPFEDVSEFCAAYTQVRWMETQ